jgi:CheY-like chemotaxis protein
MSAGPTAEASPPRTILLVDDDDRIRHNLALLLRWSGGWVVVGEAPDGVSALRLAGELRPAVVLLDRWLADGDGLGVVPRLRALAQPPLVVMLSAEVDPALQRQALALGAVGWLEKTTPPLILLQMLSEITTVA